MSAEHPHLEALKTYREMLVDKRRTIVAYDTTSHIDHKGTPYEHTAGPTMNRAPELVALQEQIEAIDRAIADEEKLKPSSGPRVRSL